MNKKAIIGLETAGLLLGLFILSMVLVEEPVLKTTFLSLLPPVIAVLCALKTKNTLLSLFVGIFIGQFLLVVTDYNLLFSIFKTFIETINTILIVGTDMNNLAIVCQCFMIGGLIALIGKSGGAKALADKFIGWAVSPKKAQLATFVFGLCIFFDDYANLLIIGPIMRPICDKLKISREKLAFIIDSTAAPVAGIFIISTWMGFELSLINDGLINLGVESVSAFSLLLQSIPFRFYNIFLLIFVFISAYTLYEYGPMKTAEKNARKSTDNEIDTENVCFDDFKPIKTAKFNIWNAIIPILTLVVFAFIAFIWSGYTTILEGNNVNHINLVTNHFFTIDSLVIITSQAKFTVALMQAVSLASIVAIVMFVGQKIFTISEAIDIWVEGMNPIVNLGIILFLAWALGSTVKSLGTANFLVSILAGSIPFWILPTLIFILASIIAFATTTSFGTMSILVPLTIPLAWAIKTGDFSYLVICISAVLSGSIFGNNISPISDTMIMSSMAAGCSIPTHVNTQFYYALFVFIISIVCGYLPAGFGVPWWLCLIVGAIISYVGIRVIGEKVA